MSNPYEAGELIDFSNPPAKTDLDEPRDALNRLIEQCDIGIERIIEEVNAHLVLAGITKQADDFQRSLVEFTEQGLVMEEMIKAAYMQMFPVDETTPRQQLLRILRETHVLQKPAHIPVKVYSHIPGELTELDDKGTHFGYILNDGEANLGVTRDQREYRLYPNTVFSFPGAVRISGNARMRIFTAMNQKGMLDIKGDIGSSGRQNYIDGCTSTLLISPVMKGDACINSLYFPEKTKQTQHTHPSIRAGIVANGEGICKTPVGDIPLQKGNSFFLPPETWHSFHTEERKTLTVVAFHPDSDFGPTHEDHPMLNRTHFEFLHKLKSAKKLRK